MGVDVPELSLPLGEGNNVGGIVSVQILLIDGSDLFIIYQDKTNFLILASEFAQNITNCLPQPPETDLYFFLPVFD